MLDALSSINARPVGPVSPASPGGRRASGQGDSGFPGLGEYGRGLQSQRGDEAEGVAKNAILRPENGAAPAPAAVASANAATGATEDGQGDSLHLSPEAQAQLRELRQRDAEVRAHEKAHMAAGGQYVAGGPSYEYQQGPDGRQYAIGGHVSIDASAIPDDPEASAAKARQVRRAALAPGEPSAQDRAVAARAAAQEARASREQQEEADESASGVEGAQRSSGAEPVARTDTSVGPENTGRSAAPEAPGDAGARDSETTPGRGGIAHALMRAAETYAVMAQRGVMPTSLAPGGTGISLQI